MNKGQWDALVLKTAPGALFQTWQWGEVEKKLGKKVWRLNWGTNAVAQVVKVSAKRGTFLHVRHGPVVTHPRYYKTALQALRELAHGEGAWFVRISPQVSKFPDLGLVPAPIHAMDAEVCWVLDLSPSEEELLSSMRKTTRYEIRRAQKLGVEVKKSHDVREFINLYAATAKRQHFVGHVGISEECEIMKPDIYVASYNNEPIAASIILIVGSQAIYHHGASIPSKIPASYLLQWRAICDAKRQGLTLYNFWGIAPTQDPNHPWQGLTAFKTGFGGRKVTYIHAMDMPISPLYHATRMIELARKTIKGY